MTVLRHFLSCSLRSTAGHRRVESSVRRVAGSSDTIRHLVRVKVGGPSNAKVSRTGMYDECMCKGMGLHKDQGIPKDTSAHVRREAKLTS